MLTILSPAKKLLNTSKPYVGNMHQPQLMTNAIELVKLMKLKSVDEIATLMDLSKDLALLNHKRFGCFNLDDHSFLQTSYPAVFIFQGDVYQGLQAARWNKDALEFSQSHLGILSGLYGYLNPLDGVQPYRLEMGVKLANSKGKNLYDFWQDTVTSLINEKLSSHANPVLLNLASNEYFKAVNKKKINAPIVTINFYEKKNNVLKMVGILAKKARGTMAKYLMENRIDHVEGVKQFKDLGYEFNGETSSADTLNFVREVKGSV